ncbi:uncharacterized protein LOC126736527 isoform X2 [Anthonomus grandis grandis]|uniref:uncharacterized protein LOC126736527 isoform X2 n=1 Tax=Anthonomus grandis grandis TaxID=2921223 RepID=UPI00216627F6|nr:uncharacterized protein LOC126736527 isoform X2 [Anthonomus grandis grandis]
MLYQTAGICISPGSDFERLKKSSVRYSSEIGIRRGGALSEPSSPVIVRCFRLSQFLLFFPRAIKNFCVFARFCVIFFLGYILFACFFFIFIYKTTVMGKMGRSWSRRSRRSASRKAYWRKKHCVATDHSYAKRDTSVTIGENMMSRNTNKESTTISNVTVPLSICQDDDESVVIESMVYDVPELPVTIYDNSNPTKVSEKIDDILMVNNDKFCNNSSQDDVTLNDFSFISQEEYDEINSHEIEIERITRPESTIIIGNRIVEVERFAELCMELQFKHSQICTLGLLKVHNEKRKGLVSTVVFRCNMCSYQAECSTQRGIKY